MRKHFRNTDGQIRTLGIEIYDPSVEDWAQGRYLVHGHDDVLWTDNLGDALSFLRHSCAEKYDAQ